MCAKCSLALSLVSSSPIDLVWYFQCSKATGSPLSAELDPWGFGDSSGQLGQDTKIKVPHDRQDIKLPKTPGLHNGLIYLF